MTPLKPLRPPWFFPAIAAAHVQSSRAFFALAFEDALHVTAPSVIRNGCPPKKVGASTCSSSGPAMKACLVFNDGQIGPAALAHDPGPHHGPLRQRRSTRYSASSATATRRKYSTTRSSTVLIVAARKSMTCVLTFDAGRPRAIGGSARGALGTAAAARCVMSCGPFVIVNAVA